MGFKESLQDDIDNVFMDLDEFAEMHKVNGADIAVIIDDEELEKYIERRDGNYDGIYRAKLLFYVKQTDLGYKPAIESIIEFDKKSYQVMEVAGAGNMLKIILGWNED